MSAAALPCSRHSYPTRRNHPAACETILAHLFTVGENLRNQRQIGRWRPARRRIRITGFRSRNSSSLRAADEFLHSHGGKACAISDDMYFIGPMEKILEIACVTRDRLQEEFQCTLQPSKSEIWAVTYRNFDPSLPPVVRISKSAPPTIPCQLLPQAGYGIMVGGLPVGDTTFIDNKLSAKVARSWRTIKKSQTTSDRTLLQDCCCSMALLSTTTATRNAKPATSFAQSPPPTFR